MKRIAIVSLLWGRHAPMLLHYLNNLDDTHPRTIFILVQLNPSILEAIKTLGHTPVILTQYANPGDVKRGCIRALSELHNTFNSPHWQAYCARLNIPYDATTSALSNTLNSHLETLVTIVKTLETIRHTHFIELMLTSEDVMLATRAAILWAKQAHIPSLHIQHGLVIGLCSVHATMLTDYMTVYGIQAHNVFTPAQQHRIHIVGNHYWDCYRQQQPNQHLIRQRMVQKYHLQADQPLIVFATTAAGKLSALYDQRLHADTLSAMFLAKNILHEQGIPIQLVIKERISNVNAEKTHPICRQTAQACGLAPTDYTYTIGDMEALILSADLLVACESSVNVEAMHAQTPTISLVAHFGLLRGPVFHAEDGVVDVCNNDPHNLARQIHRILTDTAYRDRLRTKMHAHAPRYNVTAHTGNALDNITQTIKQVLRHPPA